MPSKVTSTTKTKKTYKKKNKENHEISTSNQSTKTPTKSGNTRPKKKFHNHSIMSISMNQSMNTTNRLITDYFQIRKSSRKCKSDIEKERREYVERSIKEQSEEGLVIKHMENKGRGIFATRDFERGQFVCEYAGEMITYKQAKKREELYAQDTQIGCYMYFFEHKSKSYCIDATAETSRLGRLFNHSKHEGNCHTKLFEMNSQPYLILVASRNIKCGEEMMYDYGDRNKISLESHPWLKM